MYLWYTAAHGSMMKPPNAKVVSGNVSPPGCCHILYINIFRHYKLITDHYALLPQLPWMEIITYHPMLCSM